MTTTTIPVVATASAQDIAFFTPLIESLSTLDEVDALLQHPNASPWLLNEIGVRVREIRYEIYDSVRFVDTFRIVLNSPHLTEEGITIWERVHYMMAHVARTMLQAGEPLTEIGLLAAVGSSRNCDVDVRLLAMRSDYASEALIGRFAADYRVTVLREVAKHKLLTLETGIHLTKSTDAGVRANLCKQPWCPEETLYMFRDDANATVSRAAKRALKSRGLSETDEMDAAMEDEVSLFFLSASDDEDTLLRIGASVNATEDTLRTVAEYSERCKIVVTANVNTPSSLLEEMSLAEAENHSWHSAIRPTLAGNPSNTITGVLAIMESARWSDNAVAAGLTHSGMTAEIVNEYANRYPSKVRINAIKTGLVSPEMVDSIMKYEYRKNVLTAFIKHMGDKLSVENLRQGYMNSSNAYVQTLYMEELAKRGEPAEIAVFQDENTTTN